MRLSRFSIRTLLTLTALVAAGCYWWIARPTIVAERFVAAINSGNLDVLQRELRKLGVDFVDPGSGVFRAEMKTRSWDNVLRGCKQVVVHVAADREAIRTEHRDLQFAMQFNVTATEIHYDELSR
jgi:hypothetical protein